MSILDLFLKVLDSINMDSKEITLPSSKVQETIEKLTSNQIFIDARQILHEQSPEWTRYHKTEHSEDVLVEALTFAVEDGIEDDKSLELVGIMAITHDLGIALGKTLEGHEAIGAKWVGEQMKGLGYDEDQIKIVTESVIDTKIKMINGKPAQTGARYPLGKFLLDGDVSNFGREDFRQKTDLVLAEINAKNGSDLTIEKFLSGTLDLISSHSWQSASARRLRQDKQDENIRKLNEEIASSG